MEDFTYKVDHINPASWCSNVTVKDVNLHSCWLLKCQKAIDLIAQAQGVFVNAEAKGDVNFLSPFGSVLVNMQDNKDRSYDCSELQTKYPIDNVDPPSDPIFLSTTSSNSRPMLNGDLEDAIAKESPCRPILSEVLINGKPLSKPAALCWWLLYWLNCALTDCLCQVQEVLCFNSSVPALLLGENMVQDSDLSEPCLWIGNLAATLVRCEEQVFVALVNIIGLKFGGENDLQDLELKYLADKTAKVNFQILHMVPATQDDDPSNRSCMLWHFWVADLVVNSGIIIHKPEKPMYLFKSLALLVLAGYLHCHFSSVITPNHQVHSILFLQVQRKGMLFDWG